MGSGIGRMLYPQRFELGDDIGRMVENLCARLVGGNGGQARSFQQGQKFGGFQGFGQGRRELNRFVTDRPKAAEGVPRSPPGF